MYRFLLHDDLDLKKIADSGQCFRWKQMSDGRFRIPAFGKVLYASASPEGSFLELSCSEEEFNTVWKDYFDFGTDYSGIRSDVDPGDLFLSAAADSGKGIRILRQDPFETLVTFIISQRKNIPAIRSCVEKVCRAAGSLIGEYDGEEIYSFPSPEQLWKACHTGTVREGEGAGDVSCAAGSGNAAGAGYTAAAGNAAVAGNAAAAGNAAGAGYTAAAGSASGEGSGGTAGIESCSLGYRLPYIRETTDLIMTAFSAGRDILNEYSSLEDDELVQSLMKFRGVGIKVARCTALFGFHRLNEFPVDVWIRRALDEKYAGGFDYDRYRPYNGVIQQYIFAYYREHNRRLPKKA